MSHAISPRTAWIPALGALMLAACSAPMSDAAATKAKMADPVPSEALSSSYPGCNWEKVTGSGIEIWSYNCPKDRGNYRLVADQSLPGFMTESGDPGKGERYESIRILTKDAKAGIESLNGEMAKLSPPSEPGGCTLQPAGKTYMNPRPDDPVVRYAWAPVGDLKTRWEKASAESMDMPPPCGPYGIQYAGFYTLEAVPGDDTKVVLITWGNDLAPFEPMTLRAVVQ